MSAETLGPSTRLVAWSATSPSLGMSGLELVLAFQGRGRPRQILRFIAGEIVAAFSKPFPQLN